MRDPRSRPAVEAFEKELTKDNRRRIEARTMTDKPTALLRVDWQTRTACYAHHCH
jgi:hypothetical protein